MTVSYTARLRLFAEADLTPLNRLLATIGLSIREASMRWLRSTDEVLLSFESFRGFMVCTSHGQQRRTVHLPTHRSPVGLVHTNAQRCKNAWRPAEKCWHMAAMALLRYVPCRSTPCRSTQTPSTTITLNRCTCIICIFF